MKRNIFFSLVKHISLLSLVLLLVLSLCGCQTVELVNDTIDNAVELVDKLIAGEEVDLEEELQIKPDSPTTITPEGSTSSVEVHFLDVGQGDAILIRTDTASILIDSSYKKASVTNSIVNYIKDLGVNKLDYFILSHPHADHIGGAPTIIDTFEIDNIIMPNAVATSQIFEDTLSAIERNDANVLEAKSGDSYSVGGISFRILAPNSKSYKEMNDYSVVIRMTYLNTSAIFLGDAEVLSESEILAEYDDNEIKSDLIKIGHHGSTTSSSDKFLKAVSPKYAVISVGKDNTYGHPNDEILERLKNSGITYFRTDLVGTVVFVSNGNSFSLKQN